jgi:hypothetical protein
MKIHCGIFLFLILASCKESNIRNENRLESSEERIQNDEILNDRSDSRVVEYKGQRGVNRKLKMTGEIRNNDYIRKAEIEVQELEIPLESKPEIYEDGNVVEVSWPEIIDSNEVIAPSAGYYAKVRFVKNTGELLEVLIAP